MISQKVEAYISDHSFCSELLFMDLRRHCHAFSNISSFTNFHLATSVKTYCLM